MDEETPLFIKIIVYLSVLLTLAVIALVFPGCATERCRENSSKDIAEYQREIDALTGTVRLYEMRIETASRALDADIRELELVRERAEGIGDTVQELAELFDQYQRAVERIIRDYSDLQAKVSTSSESESCTTGSTDY